MEKITTEVIKHDGIVTIQMSGSFYKSVQAVLLYLTSIKTSEELTALIDKINAEVPSDEYDEWEQSVETLMILCSEVETKAREQQLIETIEVDVTTTPPPANL